MDTLTVEQRSQRMARVRAKDTKPELIVRRLVHQLGYRFRLHARGLPGRPDLVFAGRRKAIFVHGCFWHRHKDPHCRLARLPKSRRDFWEPKLEANSSRDERQLDELKALGWEPLVVWECQLKDTQELRDRLTAYLGPRRRPT